MIALLTYRSQAIKLFAKNSKLEKELQLAKQEAAHCRATCDELRAKLDTLEADVLDREADLILTARKDPAAMMSRQTAATMQSVGGTMKARAAIARARAGK